MRVGTLVRLKHPLPDLGVEAGELGTLRGRWVGRCPAYEVEFGAGASGLRFRALLLDDGYFDVVGPEARPRSVARVIPAPRRRAKRKKYRRASKPPARSPA
jgi:hypothetical protein